MKVLVSGINGHMGKEVAALCLKNYRGAELYAGFDVNSASDCPVKCASSFDEAATDADVIVDFSHHAGTHALLEFAKRTGIPLVLATTGQTPEELDEIRAAAETVPVFFAANYSLGIALLIRFAKQAAAAMPDADIEIVEKHHNRKLDAPSGTALAIGNAVKEVRRDAVLKCGRSGQAKREAGEIGISAVRMGNIVGEHEVFICTPSQTITLKHEAYNRSLFAEGALCAAEFMLGKPAGLYNMEDMLAEH
ncbi:MAG: 4-hydroxy-tetrahydrodipicolinate reductase [Clostridia bacterium]|nr:4-hydroxy-tetrahydrodipicolinate reductase [Clostridia bacterium]